MLIFHLYFRLNSNYTSIIHSFLTIIIIIIITSHRFSCWCVAPVFSIDCIIIDGIFNRLSHMKSSIYFSFHSSCVCLCGCVPVSARLTPL